MSEYKWKPFTLLVSAEEVKGNEMKVEAGKYYKTRDGRKVGPIRNYDDRAFYKASFCCEKWTYLENGKWSGDTKANNRDLIEEWQDEAQSPIRTVTRREIVPGTYGNVYVKGEISGHPLGRVCLVGVSTTTDAIGFTAEELREAAHLLNQIAEVLGENGE